MEKEKYIPALRFHWLTGLYDSVMYSVLRENTFKQALVRQANIMSDYRVLDLGCGTATLTLLVKQAHPKAEVTGLDGDPQALEIAAKKIAESGLAITLDEGMAFDLPYPDQSFDRVVSGLLFHHLTRADKQRALKEVYRVLKPGGELHVADWGKASNILMRFGFFFVQLLDGFKITDDNAKGLLLEFFQQAGFQKVQQTAYYNTIFGSMGLYKALKP